MQVLNFFSYYVEEDNLSRIMRGLRVDFIKTHDVLKPQCISMFISTVHGLMVP